MQSLCLHTHGCPPPLRLSAGGTTGLFPTGPNAQCCCARHIYCGAVMEKHVGGGEQKRATGGGPGVPGVSRLFPSAWRRIRVKEGRHPSGGGGGGERSPREEGAGFEGGAVTEDGRSFCWTNPNKYDALLQFGQQGIASFRAGCQDDEKQMDVGPQRVLKSDRPVQNWMECLSSSPHWREICNMKNGANVC